MENHCCSSYYLAYAMCKRGVGRQHRAFTSCQNAACSKEFFLQQVDCGWANVRYFCRFLEVVTCILIFCGLFLVDMIFPLMRVHPRSPRGSQSGERKAGRKFSDTGERATGYRLSQTISKNSSECWLLIEHKKYFVLLCPIGEQSLLSSFREFVHDDYCLDHGLSGSCTKEMNADRKLSVWYKIPIWFQNTVCPKTKDAFPKIQAWAYNRYSRLHRSRLA